MTLRVSIEVPTGSGHYKEFEVGSIDPNTGLPVTLGSADGTVSIEVPPGSGHFRQYHPGDINPNDGTYVTLGGGDPAAGGEGLSTTQVGQIAAGQIAPVVAQVNDLGTNVSTLEAGQAAQDQAIETAAGAAETNAESLTVIQGEQVTQDAAIAALEESQAAQDQLIATLQNAGPGGLTQADLDAAVEALTTERTNLAAAIATQQTTQDAAITALQDAGPGGITQADLDAAVLALTTERTNLAAAITQQQATQDQAIEAEATARGNLGDSIGVTTTALDQAIVAEGTARGNLTAAIAQEQATQDQAIQALAASFFWDLVSFDETLTEASGANRQHLRYTGSVNHTLNLPDSYPEGSSIRINNREGTGRLLTVDALGPVNFINGDDGTTSNLRIGSGEVVELVKLGGNFTVVFHHPNVPQIRMTNGVNATLGAFNDGDTFYAQAQAVTTYLLEADQVKRGRSWEIIAVGAGGAQLELGPGVVPLTPNMPMSVAQGRSLFVEVMLGTTATPDANGNIVQDLVVYTRGG